MSRALLPVFVTSLGAGMSFYVLLTVVPSYAASADADTVGAGLATGALMLSTVAAELATPRLVDRFGYRWVFAASLLLLGVPSLALIASANIAVILLVCLVRGLGFGIAVVVGSALVALLVPEERRSEGLGLFGVVAGLPAVFGLPLGAWLAGLIGFPAVFVMGAAAALAVMIVVPALPGKEQSPERPVGVVAGLRTGELLRPSIVFAATTVAAGVAITFLPLAVTLASAGLAALALFAQAAAATVFRWWAGRYADRHGSGRLLIPALLASAAGLLALVATTNWLAVVGGMILFGAGFGVMQNASLSLMFERVSRSSYSAVSAIWNLAYDAGMGLGAATFGLIVAQIGYPIAFALTSAVMLLALAPAWRDAHGPTANTRKVGAPDLYT
jgi:predicted MFS family arabinose efflux permease